MSTWLELAEGERGWTALPRLAAWMCVPGLLVGVAGLASQLARASLRTDSGLAQAFASSAGLVALLFGMIAILLTPLAAVLILVLSLRRRWQARVLGVLWLMVIAAMGGMLPGLDTALGNWLAHRGP